MRIQPLTHHRVEELLSHLNEARDDPSNPDNKTNTVLLDNIQAIEELLYVKEVIDEVEKKGRIVELDWIYKIIPTNGMLIAYFVGGEDLIKDE